MASSIFEVTAWIRQSWPHVPEHSLRQRAHNVNAYLAFPRPAPGAPFCRLSASALMPYIAEPTRFWTWSTVEFIALFYSHLFGIRRYNWCFWAAAPPLQTIWAQRSTRLSRRQRSSPSSCGPTPLRRSGAWKFPAEAFSFVDADRQTQEPSRFWPKRLKGFEIPTACL